MADEDIEQSRRNSSQAFVTLERFLRRLKWKPERIPKLTAWQVNFDDEGPICGCAAHILPDTERFVFFVQLNFHVPPEHRTQVAEFITRINYGTVIGNYELDLGDGEVRYRASLDFRGQELTENLVANAIASAMDATEDYVEALLAVARGEKTASEAFAASAS
ncbi:MAG: YbjN domain-containing protein [Polyangiaceae bacterium]|jgi:hypothetical protein|nr:YbjN domain-containing protein [Polyangiaceae bacterium]